MKVRLLTALAFVVIAAVLTCTVLGGTLVSAVQLRAGLPTASAVISLPDRAADAASHAAAIVDAQNVEFVGHIGGATDAVAVQGSYAYIGEGPRLTILDISSPPSPIVVGKTGPLPSTVKDVAISGSYAYVATLGAGLRVLDISTPANPTEVGFFDAPGSAYGVTVTGDYAYVAAGDLYVVDVSTPANPAEVGLCDMPGWAFDVAVVGSYAYVAEAPDWDGSQYVGGGLRIVDISAPGSPTEVGFYDAPRSAYDVAVTAGDPQGHTHAYVAAGRDGLRVVDVSVPASPTEVGFYGTPGSAEGIAVAGGYAYVAAGDLRVVDVSTPASPMEVGFCETVEGASAVAVVAGGSQGHTYAYVAADGLRAVDVSTPANPAEVGLYHMPGSAQGVAVVAGGSQGHTYAYVAADDLWVVDVSAPASPTNVGLCETPGWAEDVAVAGDYAYVADARVWDGSQFVGGGLRVVDVSEPTIPEQVGLYDVPGWAEDVVVAGSYAYLVGNSGYPDYDGWLRVVDISTAANPTEVGFYDTPGAAQGVAVAGGYAYVADGSDGGLRVVDVSIPTSPTEVGFYDTPGEARGVAVAAGEPKGHIYVYVADYGEGLRVVDVSIPTSPTEVGFYDTPGAAEDIAVAAGGLQGHPYAYVAADGLRVVDISTPASLTEMGFYDTSGSAQGIAVAAGDPQGCTYAYIADGWGGLVILRHLQPSVVTGCVLDNSGDPIEGVQVIADTEYSTTTDTSGTYTITDILPGTYTLIPATAGYFWSPSSRTITVPPDATGQDFVGLGIHKVVAPSGPYAIDYSSALTFMVHLVFPVDRSLVLYDRVPTYTTYISGSLNAPAGVIYDSGINTISGTLSLSATVPETVTFAVRVGITGTVGFAPVIANRACVHPVGGGLADCEWSNEVRSYTYVWSIYLPLALRNH